MKSCSKMLLWCRTPNPFSFQHKHEGILFPAKLSLPFRSSLRIPLNPGIRFHSIPAILCSSNITSDSSAATDSVDPPNIFVKGLPLTTTEGRLKKAFSEFGVVQRVKILIQNETGVSQGRAFIWMDTEENAQLAIKKMNGKFFDGKFIVVTVPKSSSKKEKNERFYKF